MERVIRKGIGVGSLSVVPFLQTVRWASRQKGLARTMYLREQPHIWLEIGTGWGSLTLGHVGSGSGSGKGIWSECWRLFPQGL